MALSFSMTILKTKAAGVGIAKGHNCRLHPTKSQLPKRAWFTPEGRHKVIEWRHELAEKAKGLAKRKDAVQAIQFVIQLGNQTDWRDAPTLDFPEGKPNQNVIDAANAMTRGIWDWVNAEFGKDNVVGIDFHTDESSPHFHVVVAPIKDGKLQAKAWLDGPSKVAAMRKRAWQAVNAHIPCEYTPGAAGGAPHDPGKAAGQAEGQAPAPSMIDKVTGHAKAKRLERENAALREENAKLKQVLFSRQKGRYSADNLEKAREAERNTENAQKALGEAKQELLSWKWDAGQHEQKVKLLEAEIGKRDAEISKLKGYNRQLAEQNNELDEKLRELMPKKYQGPRP